METKRVLVPRAAAAALRFRLRRGMWGGSAKRNSSRTGIPAPTRSARTPPNAVIELRDASGKTLLVTVTLISMTQDGGDLIYRIRPLDVKDLGLALQGRAGKALNEIPVGEFLSPVLFIDYVIGIL